MMKKIHSAIAFFLVICMLLTITACKKSSDTSKKSPKKDSSVVSSAKEKDIVPGTTDGTDSAGSFQSTESTVSQSSGNFPTSGNTSTSGIGNGSDSAGDADSSSTDSEKSGPVSTGKWTQKQFYLSTIWPYEFSASSDTQRMKAIDLCKEAGLNLVELAIGGTPSETVLNHCDSIGINVLVGNKAQSGGLAGVAKWNDALVKNEVYKLYRHKSIIGYLVWDEVALDQMTIARDLIGTFNKYDPARLAYSCLLPSYGVYNWYDQPAGGNWKDGSYYKYVDTYIKTVNPAVLSFDYYPFILDSGNNIIKRDWYRDLGLFRSLSLKLSKPFWYYMGTVDGNDAATTTDAQIRVQMNIGLAYGAKYLSIFNSVEYLYGKSTFEKTDRFDNAKEIFKTTRAMGDFLFDKTGTALYHTGLSGQETCNEIYFLDNLADSDLIASAPVNLIVSMFKDKNGGQYMMVVTKSLKSKVIGTIKLKTAKSVAQFDPATGKMGSAVTTDSITYTLTPGGATIYRLK